MIIEMLGIATAKAVVEKIAITGLKKIYVDIKADYEAGLVPVSDLLEAQTLLLQAHNQRTDARIDLKIKSERYKTLVR